MEFATGRLHFCGGGAIRGRVGEQQVIMECITALAVLGIVIIGLLLIIQAITLDEALQAIGRVLGTVVLFLVGLCLFTSILQTIIQPWLASLLPLLAKVALIAFVILLLALVTNIVRHRVMNRDRKSINRGEP